MIKLNTTYRTKKDYYIVIIRNSKDKRYEMHCSIWQSNLQNSHYLLEECYPYYVFDKLSDARYYAGKIIDGEGCII